MGKCRASKRSSKVEGWKERWACRRERHKEERWYDVSRAGMKIRSKVRR